MTRLRPRPQACQGAIAVTARADDTHTIGLLAGLENTDARLEIETERAFLGSLDGSCRMPIAALARKSGGALTFIGEALTPDGTARWRRTGEITLGANALLQAQALGHALGREIREEAGDAFIMGDA